MEANRHYEEIDADIARGLYLAVQIIDKYTEGKAETSQGWIPVSERLPNNHEYIKNNGLFNVSDGNRSYFGWFDIYDTKKFVKPTIAGFCVDNAVTAWMPLPEPYKAESEEV